MKIGNLEVEKILIGSQEVEKILLGADDIWEPESGAPSSNTYYYQISGGSKTQMTEVSEGYWSTSAISGLSGQVVRFFADDDIIPASAITDDTQLGEFAHDAVLEDAYSDDGYMKIKIPIEDITFHPDSEAATPYTTWCTPATVYMVLDGVPSEMTIIYDGGGVGFYSWSSTSNIPVGSVYQVMTLGSYGTWWYYDDGGSEVVTSAYTAQYCQDAYYVFTIYCDYAQITPNMFNCQDFTSQGYACSTYYAYVNGNNTYVNILDDCTEYNTSDLGLTIEDNDEFYIGLEDGTYDSGIEVYLNDTSIGYQPVTLSFAAPGMHSQVDRISWCGSQVNLYVDSDDPFDPGDDPGEFEL